MLRNVLRPSGSVTLASGALQIGLLLLLLLLIKWWLKIPPHLKRVATLPCEILMSENKRQFETGTVINDVGPVNPN